jgi:transposase InsO family protein
VRLDESIKALGLSVLKSPPRAPKANAYAERFARSIKEECLERMIFVGQAALRRAITEFVSHYHIERNHQGLQNQLIRADSGVGTNGGIVRGRPRLGGILNYYYRAAA